MLELLYQIREEVQELQERLDELERKLAVKEVVLQGDGISDLPYERI